VALVAAAYALNCLIWSSTWMVIKVGLRGAPPMTAVAARFLVAAVLISVVVAAARLPVPRTRRFLAISLFLGAFHLALPYVLVYWGEQHISSGLTAVLYSTLPLMVAVLARIILGDPLTPTKLAGIAAGVAGVWFIFSDAVHVTAGSEVAGMVAVLTSVFFAALASVVIKKYSGGYHPIVSLMIPFVVGAVMVSSFAVPLEHSNPLHYDGVTWATILYLAVAGSFVAFAVFFWLMKRIDVTVVSYQTFIIPILAVFFGWLFLDETISARVAVGAAFIVGGIVIATAGARRGRAEGK
jgi:drug/metabolite transporter (DMT)-like permease